MLCGGLSAYLLRFIYFSVLTPSLFFDSHFVPAFFRSLRGKLSRPAVRSGVVYAPRASEEDKRQKQVQYEMNAPLRGVRGSYDCDCAVLLLLLLRVSLCA